MDFEQLFVLAIVIARIVSWLVRRKRGTEPKPTDVTGSARTQAMVGSVRQRIERSQLQANGLTAQLESFEPDVRQRVGPVLTEVSEELATMGAEYTAADAALENLDEPSPEIETAAVHAIDALATIDQLLSIIATMLDQRRKSTLDVLGDADALAEACYRPIHDFVTLRGGVIQSTHPITFFHRGGTSVRLAFVRYHLAPVALPFRFATEPWRWPAIAHEIAHDLFMTTEGLADEVVEQLGLRVDTNQLTPGTKEFTQFLYSAWLEELFADAVGTLMIGPAYLRSMIALFARPDALDAVRAMHVDDEGRLDPHPPRHLRVYLTAHLIEQMGFSREARDLVREWDRLHGPIDALALRATGRSLALPIEPYLDRGREIMGEIYSAQLDTFDGHRLADIPGLEFGRAERRRELDAKKHLMRGQTAPWNARALVAAATEAALDRPDRIELINESVRASIVGVGTAERRARHGKRVVPAKQRQPAEVGRKVARQPPVTPVTARAAAVTSPLPAAQARSRRRRPGGDRLFATPTLTPAALVDALILHEIIDGEGRQRAPMAGRHG